MFSKVAVVVFCVVIVVCSATMDVAFKALKCQKYPEPKNGMMSCTTSPGTNDVICAMTCFQNFDVNFLGSQKYICKDDGTWVTQPPGGDLPWPDCRMYGRGEPVP